MEGRWRGAARIAWLLVVAALIAVAAGCGDSDGADRAPGAVETKDPAKAFAPLLEIAADEPWRPMGARWFIERSVLGFAEDEGCADRKIAVGHTLPEQWTPDFDWIFPKGLGGWSWPAYDRNPFDASCELDGDLRFDAGQLTRPHDPGPRVVGIRPGEGFYLDLVDDARAGPPSDDGEVAEPVYTERIDEGDGSVRLVYWTLYGMRGDRDGAGGREGDWQRLDVLLRDHGDALYEPLGIDFGGPRAPKAIRDSQVGDAPWSELTKVGETHPVVRVERATHDPIVARADGPCDCLRWETWRWLSDAREEVWYGFGGAWGEPGATDATTGPLGPHRYWPTAGRRQREEQQAALVG